MAAFDNGAKISIGSVLGRGFAVPEGNPIAIYGFAFLFGGLPSGVLSWLQTQRFLTAENTGFLVITQLLVTAFSILLYLVATGAIITAGMAVLRGERASLGACLQRAITAFLPLFILSILMFFAIGIASLFLLVPGIILYMMWAVAPQVLIVERASILGSLKRSADLTSGSRWRIFGLLLVVWGSIIVFSSILTFFVVMMGGFGLVASLVLMLLRFVSGTLVQAFMLSINTALYAELAEIKYGATSETLAETFA
jgi:hypothetical protein